MSNPFNIVCVIPKTKDSIEAIGIATDGKVYQCSDGIDWAFVNRWDLAGRKMTNPWRKRMVKAVTLLNGLLLEKGRPDSGYGR